MAYSIIKRKPCKKEDCLRPPKMGCKGYCSLEHMPDEMRIDETKKTVEKRVKKYNTQISRKLHNLRNESKKENNSKFEPPVASGSTKSTLMVIADKVFGDFIKKRDKDDQNRIKCPCCNQFFNLDAKTDNGEQIVNAMHFVSRSVYSLRYDERNVWAGCCYCNSKQHQNPSGKQYQKFKDFLTLKLGIGIIWQMETARRNVNKLTEGDLRDIITRYSKQ